MCVIHQHEFALDYRWAKEKGFTEYTIDGIWYDEEAEGGEEWYHLTDGDLADYTDEEFVELCTNLNMPYDELFVGFCR